jgi:hypothetical protein
MLDERFVILAGIINISGILLYVYDTIKGHSKPNRVTWFLWSLVPFIAFSAQIKQGVGLTSVLTFTSGFGPFLVLVTSLLNKNAYWELKRFDLVCGAIAIIGVILWLVTKNPNLAIIFSITADGFAALPTLVKSFKFPETESMVTYLLASFGALLTLFTIDTWKLEFFAFPLYIFILCLTITIFIKFKVGARIGFRDNSKHN